MFIATRESKHLYSIKTGEVPFGYVYRGLSGETWYVSIDEKAKHYLAGDKLEQAFELIENYLKGEHQRKVNNWRPWCNRGTLPYTK